MTFPREKRVLLGWLALLAPLPLPFNEVLEWPALFVYLVAVIHFLGRAEDPTRRWLDNRALNGLGLLYLPLFAIDAWQGAQRGQLVTPLLHLSLFVLVVKLYSVRQEKEKWHVVLAVFFVFVAAMATSSHVTVVLYLLAAVALGLFALARLAELHMLAALGLACDGGEAAEAPAARRPALPLRRRRGALWGVLAVVLLAAPIFAALPRLAQPFLTGRGAGNLGLSRVSGFSDEVSLDFTGEIRTRREVAMRLRFSYPVSAPEEMRFKGAAYDNYRDRRWFRDSDLFAEVRPKEGRFELGGGPEIANAIVYLEPLSSNSVIVPSEAVSLQFPGGPSRLYTDGGGGVVMRAAGQRSEILEYQVGLGERANLHGRIGDTPSGYKAALDVSAVSPRMAELGHRVMGEGSSEEKIVRLERFLLSEYSYTLDISDEGGSDPIEDFLFVSKAGHCEYFATAMVLLLRSEGIPARFVSGFLGAEPNAIEDVHVVRQSNAHAWVEAYVAETGAWEIHDPTPPAGRPGVSRGGLALLARQLYEFVAFRWDRYVLTYGAEDQGNLREKVQGLLADTWRRLRAWLGITEAGEEAPGQGEGGGAVAAVEGEAGPAASADSRFGWLSAALVAVVAAAAALLFWRRRPATATAFYLALRRLLEAAEPGVTAATPPLELRDRLRGLLPEKKADVERLVALYLEEGFAGRPLQPAEREELRGLRPGLEKALRRRLAEDRKRSRDGARKERAAA